MKKPLQQLENLQKINRITMTPTAITKCKIGQDWFRNKLEIVFIPDKCYPDYMEVEAFIMDEIDGQELNIEEVVFEIYDMLQSEYKPTDLVVVDHITGCKSHFDVTVSKGNLNLI